MRRYRWITLAVLLMAPAGVHAQPSVGGIAPGAFGIYPPTTVGSLESCVAGIDGRVQAVTDGADATDCTTGSGTTPVLCQCDGGATTWTSVPDGSGHGNGANCSAGNAPLGVDADGAVEGCYDVATQAELDALSSDSITDADGDTTIQVEEGADDDTIRFDSRGSEIGTATSNGTSATWTLKGIAGTQSVPALNVDADGDGTGDVLVQANGSLWVSSVGGGAGTPIFAVDNGGGTVMWYFSDNPYNLIANVTGGPQLFRATASLTIPTFAPYGSDADTGIGANGSNTLGAVAGGASVQTWANNGTDTIATVADIFKITPQSTAPSTTALGSIYVDSDLNLPCFYTGSNWVQMDDFTTVCN